MGFWPVLKKNFRIIFNSKLSLLIFIFGPLFLMGIVGAALQNNQLRDVQASVYAYEESSGELLDDDWYVNGYKDQLVQNSFIVRSVGSLEECKEDVLNSRAHVCIEIVKKPPIELETFGVEQDINYETNAYVDFSKSRIVWGVIAKTQAVSEQYSRILIQNLLVSYRDKLEQPMNELQNARSEIDDALVLLDMVDAELDYVRNDYRTAMDIAHEVDANVILLRSRVQAVVNAVNAIPELDQSVRESVNSLNQDFQIFDNSFGELYSKLNTARVVSGVDEAKNLVRQVRGGLWTVKNNVDNVLEQWEEISEMDYNSLAPLSFQYQSVTDGDSLEGGAKKSVILTTTGRKLEFLDYLFPSFLMFFIIFVSLVFSTVMTFKERSSKAHIRNVTSRTSAFSFVLGNFASMFVILALQIIVILGVSIFFLRANILANLLPLIIYSFVGLVLFIFGGMAVAYIFNSQDGAVIASVSLSLLFLIFLPVITAPETLPFGLSRVVNSMPFVILESKLRMASIFNLFSLPSIVEAISLMLSFSLSVVLIFYFYAKRKRYELS
jgi:ABC-type multidrug transport system permease subunit